MPGDRLGDRRSDCKDHISPYKIAILVVLKEHSKFIDTAQDEDACSLILCIHNLIQIPDMDLAGLFNELKSITSLQFVEAVQTSLHQLCNGTVNLLNDLMDTAPSMLLYTPFRNLSSDPMGHTNTGESLLHKGSVLGIFVRRMALSFEKMDFYEICRLYSALCSMYSKAFPRRPSRTMEYDITPSRGMNSRGLSTWHLDNRDFTGDRFVMTPGGSVSAEGDEDDDDDDDNEEEDMANSKKYSHKQANYFVAQQAYLLNYNEFEALPPKELHSKTQELLKCHPNFPEAHFLKYMNFLRVKEYKASLDSLFSYFDRIFDVPGDSGSKNDESDSSNNHGYRYAALNVAAMAYRFGHRNEAMAAILECIKISQQNNDSVCLQHALSWLHRLEMPEEGNPLHMLERLVASSNEYNLPELASMGCQSYAKQAYLIGAQPSLVFENMMASDITNSDHDLSALSCAGFAQKSALWNLYGFDNLNKANNYLILNSISKESQIHHNGEPHCLALCHVARDLMSRGDYDSSSEIIKFLKKRFPQMSNLSHIWILCDQQIRFQMTLLQGCYSLSDRAIRDMAAVNGLEGSYSRCVYLAETGELERSLELVHILIDRCKVKNSGNIQTNNLLIRCLLLKCNICCSLEDPTAAIGSIVEASRLSREKNFSHMIALVHAHVAFLQLKMEMYEAALGLLASTLPDVLNTTSCLDRARILFLHVRCWMAYSNHLGDLNSQSINRIVLEHKKVARTFPANMCNGKSGCDDNKRIFTSDTSVGPRKRLITREMLPIMDEVCCNFKKVKAYHRLKDALFFQALMYNELGMVRERNRTSLLYNQVDSQLINSSSTIKFCSALF